MLSCGDSLRFTVKDNIRRAVGGDCDFIEVSAVGLFPFQQRSVHTEPNQQISKHKVNRQGQQSAGDDLHLFRRNGS